MGTKNKKMDEKKFNRMIELMVVVNTARAKICDELKELQQLQREYYDEVNEMKVFGI